MKTIPVQTSTKNCIVHFGDIEIGKIIELINQTAKCDNYFILIDKNVNRIYGRQLINGFNSLRKKNHFFQIYSSEKQKSFPTVQKIYNELVKHKFGRDTCMVLIGGGIIGDLGGFAASTYMRGIKCIQVPTTILAAVDSSIGGKTGYNYKSTKNLIGSFYQPESVIANAKFFSTLPIKEIDSGIGEIIKYSYLSGKRFFEFVSSNYNSIRSLDAGVIKKVLNECISIKTSIVFKDEKEYNIRKILNFGHTFAHAFESYFNYKITHGKAVAAGILAANILSFRQGFISISQLKLFQNLPAKVSLPKFLADFDTNKLIEKMILDKKSMSGNLNFVLLKNFGELIIDVKVSTAQLKRALDEFKKTISV